jgi:hypothetical protein
MGDRMINEAICLHVVLARFSGAWQALRETSTQIVKGMA